MSEIVKIYAQIDICSALDVTENMHLLRYFPRHTETIYECLYKINVDIILEMCTIRSQFVTSINKNTRIIVRVRCLKKYTTLIMQRLKAKENTWCGKNCNMS